MAKMHLIWLISGLLLLGIAVPQVTATPQGGNEATSVEKIKSQVAKLGLGEKARATITTKDGTKIKGYVARADDDDFVMRDRKTDTPTTIRYADVAKVERNRVHSTARNIAIGVGIGAGALLAAILITIAHLD